MLSIDFVLILIGDEGELLLAGYFLLPLAPIAYRRFKRPPVGFLLDMPCHLATSPADRPSLFQ